MASNKRSALRKQKAAMEARFANMDDIYEREERRQQQFAQRKEAALRHKACSSKNRYATRHEAQAAIASCAEYGTHGLTCYRCPHCNGWHLTSHGR